MIRIRLLALGYLLAGFITACSNVVAVSNSQPNSARLYVQSILRPYIYGVAPGGWRHSYLLLLADGTAFRHLPDMNLHEASREARLAQAPDRVGTYLEQDSSLQITWQDGNSWTLTRQGDSWQKAGKKEPFRPARTLNAAGFEGAYSREVSGILGFGPTPATFASQARFIFFEEGRFVVETLASGPGSGANGFSEQRFSGSYALDGYTLNLRYDDGTVEEQTVFIWSDTDDSILSIHGALYEQEVMPADVAPGESTPFCGVRSRVGSPGISSLDVSLAVVAACPLSGGETICDAPNAANVQLRGDGYYALKPGVGDYAVFALVDINGDGRLGGGDYRGVFSQDGQGASLVNTRAESVDIQLEGLESNAPELSGRVFTHDGSSPAGGFTFACPISGSDFSCTDSNAARTNTADDVTYQLSLVADSYIVMAVQDANSSGELDAGDYFGYFSIAGKPSGVTPPASGVDIQMVLVTATSNHMLREAGITLPQENLQ